MTQSHVRQRSNFLASYAETLSSTAGERSDNARWLLPGAEAFVAIVSALVFPMLCLTIRVDTLDRTGQVSGLAALQTRFFVCAGAIVLAMMLAHRFLPSYRRCITQLGCAAAAGLSTGLVGGGVVVILNGTPHGLWAGSGDYAILLSWIHMIGDGQEVPHYYPPAILYLIGGTSWLTDLPLLYSLKIVQIIGTALHGPAAYLAWRSVLRPGWALGIGVVAMLPFIEPVKPYTQISLVMLIPLLIAFLRRLRHVDDISPARGVALGTAFGAAFGLLFLLYSGWFVWIVPGALVGFVLLFPWKDSVAHALRFVASAALAFVATSWIHLSELFHSSGAVSDGYFYFETASDPAYVAMWRNLATDAWERTAWPPPGELGGVGLFTVLLVAGLSIAIWLGWRRSIVTTLLCCGASAWFLRMLLASWMHEDSLVRLYPRTTMVILYVLLISAGLAVKLGANALHDQGLQFPRAPAWLLLIPLFFLFASVGSATIDRYMPSGNVDDYGGFATIAYIANKVDGTCSPYGLRHGICTPAQR